jgi:hypothetical protein
VREGPRLPRAMLSSSGSLRIFIALDPCDMRAGINTLHALVSVRLREELKNGALFVFSKNRPVSSMCSTGMAPAASSKPSSMPSSACLGDRLRVEITLPASCLRPRTAKKDVLWCYRPKIIRLKSA